MKQAHDSRELTFTRIIIASSFAVSIALCWIAGIRTNETAYSYWLIAMMGILALLWFASGFCHRKGMGLGFFVTIAILNFCLVVPELGLRVAGFWRHSGVVDERQFGYPRRTHFRVKHFVSHERLFWTYPPDSPGANAWGFPGDTPTVPKGRGVFRILFLGDSCMEQGYPALVGEILNRKCSNGGRHIEVVTLALSGYSSHQGRVIAELYGAKIAPDLAVVAYGWNDHWLAYNSTDANKVMPRPPKSLFEHSVKFLEQTVYPRVRLLQLVNWWVGRPAAKSGQLKEVRVPEKDYKYNLRKIHDIFAAMNCPVIYLTPPTSAYRLGDFFPVSFAVSQESAIALHKRYNDIVREVAQEEGSPLVDLENEMGASKDIASLFTGDRIHFTPEGLKTMANDIARFILEKGLIKPACAQSDVESTHTPSGNSANNASSDKP